MHNWIYWLVALFMIAWVFIAPAIVVHAWTLFAVGLFAAPALPYWTSFWVTWAIHILFTNGVSRIVKKDD